jgi:flagellar biosynthesis/type III secretory pathway protein FliH
MPSAWDKSEEYARGYRAGHEDGYEDRPRVFIFLGRTIAYMDGYNEGYESGQATRAYARKHGRTE